MFEFGLDIKIEREPLGFKYGKEVFGSKLENRYLNDIRKSLMNKNLNEPNIVYSIAMDVGKEKDKKILKELGLLFGIVIYQKGRLGKEPVKSQGHIHNISKFNNTSTAEVYEIWEGEGIIYMQEWVKDYPGRCFAVNVKKGDIVIVPPYWAHCTINSNPNENLVFGAWCVRDYGFLYEDIRKYGGLAFFPVLDYNDDIQWVKNNNYTKQKLIIKLPRRYDEFGINEKPIYTQFEEDNEKFLFVVNPIIYKNYWNNFVP